MKESESKKDYVLRTSKPPKLLMTKNVPNVVRNEPRMMEFCKKRQDNTDNTDMRRHRKYRHQTTHITQTTPDDTC